MLLAVCASASALAQTGEPVITFKTNIYDTYGESNEFSIVIGMNGEGQYIDVDCGFGPVEYEAEAAVADSSYNISGTMISCQVSKEGIVKIYGDASQIDYFNAAGCYIESIDLSKLTNLLFLDLSHNELKSLDLTGLTKLQSIDIADNVFSAEHPFTPGTDKPDLAILTMNTVDYVDASLNLSDYPQLVSFDGYHSGIKTCDPTGCPELLRLTLDVTDVETVDVSKNTKLLILNISNTRITSIDVSQNPYLTQFFCDHTGSYNYEYKIEKLDLTNNPELVYLFCAGNKLTELDITKNPRLVTLSATDNYLTSLDVSQNPNLYIVEINKNCMDFATLPEVNENWNTYYYGQRNFTVDKSYPSGTELDFSSRVIREGTETDAIVYMVSETSPESGSELDSKFYTYENGKIKFTELSEVPEDSVYVAFANTAFPDAILRTDKFMIKKTDEYGKPSKAFSFTGVNGAISFGVGVAGATAENPKTFYVDFGDNSGNLVEFTATTSAVPETANVTGTKGYGPVIVYMPEGETLSAIDVRNVTLYSADPTPSASLRTLNLVNTGLYSIDLSWNRCLENLDLSGNNLYTLTLEGNNGSYAKNSLNNINLSNNKLSSITFNNLKAVHYLDISHNDLETIDFSDADYIKSLNVSYNKFDEIQLDYCSVLSHLDISHNNISEITLPTENNIEYMACNDNLFTLADVPERGAKLTEENYVYAPQADYQIATKGPGIDLSEMNRNGKTQYVWKDANGNALVEGVDYTNNNGLMKFLNTEVGNIYCEMSNADFPDFTGDVVYKTTAIEAAGMPTNEVASFTTTNNGDVVTLSLAAAQAGTALYFGWDGTENLSQYLLGTTYRIFSATTKAGVNVKVYTYEPTEKISVFSMSGATLSDCDLSKLTDAINVSIYNSGCPDIKLPESAALEELGLEGNNIAEFDPSKYPSLRLLGLTKNALTTIDLSNCANLQEAYLAYNNLTEVKFNNEKLWSLMLDHNQFTTIDLSGVPNLRQFSISNNKLTEIDVESLSKLIMLSVVGNCFTFKTLPLVKDTYAVYYYSNQAPIDAVCVDGKVDLSDQATVDGTATAYAWYLGMPVTNADTGELEGEILYEDTEYTVDGGVTTFLASFDDAVCLMTNEKLPNVYIYTNPLDVVSSGIETVKTDAVIAVTVKGNDVIVKTAEAGLPVNLVGMNGAVVRKAVTEEGATVLSGVEAGAYIVTVGNKGAKILVK